MSCPGGCALAQKTVPRYKIMVNFLLTRVFYTAVSMPELLAHTNMDPQSISKLREHIESLICFLAKNPEQYISAHYESGSYQS